MTLGMSRPVLRFSYTMSTTAPNSHEHRVGVPADKAFDELAFHEPTVCSRCFSLIRRHDTFRPDADGGVSKYAPEERCVRAFDGGKGYKIEAVEDEPDWIDWAPIPAEDFVYGYRPLHEPRTFCDECGSQSGRADDSDLSRRQTVLFAAHLANRLIEADVDVDTDELKRAVGLLKSKVGRYGCDTEIFRRATKIAIRRARVR